MKTFLKALFGLIISFIFIYLIINQLDINKVFSYFKSLNKTFILLGSFVYVFSFLFRAFRWKLILVKESVSYSNLLNSVFYGYAGNYLLPARMGEFYRAYFLGKKENISKVKILSSIVFERIIDGFILFLFLLLVVFLFFSNKPWLLKLSTFAGFIFLGGIIVLFFMNKYIKNKSFSLPFIPVSLNKKINNIFHNSLKGVELYNHKRKFAQVLLLSLIIWFFEIIFMFFIIKSFNINIQPFDAVLVLTVTAFSTMIPAGPASLGPFNWGFIKALSVLSVSSELAFAASLMCQFVSIMMVSFFSLMFAWRNFIFNKFSKINEMSSDIENLKNEA